MDSSRVALISTGGTIASTNCPSSAGVTASLSAAELLERVDGLQGVHVESVIDLARINSWDANVGLMRQIARTVESEVERADIEGVVVTHGTDTLEEVAFLSDILINSDKPVVFTAAMRSADSLSPDGPHNLRTALYGAASPQMRDLGVTVCLGDEFHAARWVRKAHTYRVDAFRSNWGPVATVGPDGRLRRHVDALPRVTIEGAAPLPDDAVLLLRPYTGMSTELVRILIAKAQPRGIVVDGFGLGNVAESVADVLAECVASGIVVGLSTRVVDGGVWPVYGGKGGGASLANSGLIGTGELSSAKARLLLLACLGTDEREDPGSLFQEAIDRLSLGQGVFQ
jgi:L-asparaginase